MEILLILVLVVLVAILVCLLLLLRDVNQIRSRLLPNIRTALLQGHLVTRPVTFTHWHQGPPPIPDSFVIWQWKGTQWKAIERPHGVDPGEPPETCGTFDGEYRRTWVPGSL